MKLPHRIMLVLFCVALLTPALLAFAQVEELDELNSEVSAKKSQIDKINGKIDTYRKKVQELTNRTASLLNDIELLENQIALAQLDIDSTRAQIEAQELEISLLEERITQETATIEEQRLMMREILFEMQKNGEVGFVQVLFSSDDFNELFSAVDMLEHVNTDLQSAAAAAKIARQNLEENRQRQASRLDGLVDLQKELQGKVRALEDNVNAKDILVSETQSSESQYRVLMSELRQEQQYITSQISSLQAEIEKRLRESDQDGGDPGVFNRPLDSYIVTALFHDPSYPFRRLFEHSGIDLAAPSGTPVRAAAPGVVAWTRTGSSYGNYIMVIHEGGYATLYAHLSRFNIKADQFVTRGQVIGYVGSTGFSTGPHLHFEVRLNGIPVNPGAYVSF